MKTLEYERGAKVKPVGGYFVKELDVMTIVELAKKATRGWLRSKGNSIEGGTSEINLNVVAKRVLGLREHQ